MRSWIATLRGAFTSRVLDAGASVGWTAATWNADLPSGTAVTVSVSTGNTPIPDGTWTAFTALAGPGANVGRTGRYLRYQLALTTSNAAPSPARRDITFNHT